MFVSYIAVFGLFVVVVVVLLIVKKRILSVFFFEGKCYKIMSFFAKFIQCFVSFVCFSLINEF